jgi:UDP-N-acetylmuramate--alanine ligase
VNTSGRVERYHLVGIGGIGMSAIARLLLARGAAVTGSDLSQSELVRELEAEGAIVKIGHRAENVGDATMVVVSTAIAADNPERTAAVAKGIPVVRRGTMLSRLIADRQTIAVAGTHGKTTTTAMIATILEAAGLDPGVAVGGVRRDTGSNARAGTSAWFVTEADESDGSFLELTPQIALILNVENDHVANDDEFHDLLMRFDEFSTNVSGDGIVIYGSDDKQAADLAIASRAPKTRTFAIRDIYADFVAEDVTFEGLGSSSEILEQGLPAGTMRLRVPGEINVQNALAAFATARVAGVPADVALTALANFRGVGRRFEVLFAAPRWTLIDDYAHHPTAIAATIAAARNFAQGAAVVVAFEPHRYTRTRFLAPAFVDALAGADAVVLAPIYAAAEQPLAGVDAKLIGDPLAARGVPVSYAPTVDDAPGLVARVAPHGAMVLFLGAGGITKVARKFAESEREDEKAARDVERSARKAEPARK